MGIFNYFSFIDNTKALSRIYNILRSSAAKLLAAKFKLKTQRAVYVKFGKGLKTEKGKSLIIRSDWKKNTMDFKINPRTDLPALYINRLTKSNLLKICAICGSIDKIEMHHVKHIKKMNKDLTVGEKSMASLNRKQIPVCRVCHMDIHNGTYDGKSLKEIIKFLLNIKLLKYNF